MAKPVYKIPASINSNWLDLEIALRSDSGIGIKPLPMKFILAVIGSGLGWFWVLNVTPIGSMNIGFLVLFTFAWIYVSALLLHLDKTGEMAISRVPILIQYLPKSARRVFCRTGDNAGPFYTIANIDGIDEDRGIIQFADGTFGYAFRVVGSGSVLLFESDREAILARVDAFFRNMKTEYEIIFITAKEAQNVKRQVNNMTKRIMNLQGDDPELIALAEMERAFLENYVGREYRSIHQYMILKAGSMESLNTAKNMLRAEIESSTLMIKRCVSLYDDELHGILRSIYQGKESL